jgi:hypothetical protein
MSKIIEVLRAEQCATFRDTPHFGFRLQCLGFEASEKDRTRFRV